MGIHQAAEASGMPVMQAISLHVYLEDWLIYADSPRMAIYHAQLLIRVLRHLDDQFSEIRTRPYTRFPAFQFIGMQFRTQDFTMPPLSKMHLKVQAILNHWCWATTVSALDVHRMLGTIQYMAPLVPQGRLLFRPIQWWALTAWDQSTEDWDQWICVLDWVIRQLAWWASLAVCQGLSLRSPDTDVTLYTDASLLRLGAQLGGLSLSGQWSPAPSQNHINTLELDTVLCAVRGLLNNLHGRVVRLKWDSATVVSYIKQEGRTRSFRLTRLTMAESECWSFVTGSGLC